MISKFNFAEVYRTKMIAPKAEDIARRMEVIKTFQSGLTSRQVADLTRIYFGMPAPPASTEWFLQAFSANDETFSIVGNEQEAGLLAVALLATSLDTGHIASGLAPLCATVCGHRQPILLPELIERFEHQLQEISFESRENVRTMSPALTIAEPDDDDDDTEVEDEDVHTLVLKADSQLRADINDLASRALGPESQLASEVRMLREENNLLWWFISDWSKSLNCAFGELTPSSAAIVAGIDMATLTRTPPGRVAAPALLERLVLQTRSGKPDKSLRTKEHRLQDALAGLKGANLSVLPVGAALPGVFDICPVLTSLAKAQEVGSGVGWTESFTKATGLAEDISFTLLTLGQQAFRESMLITLLGG